MPGPTPEQLANSGSEAAHQTALMCWSALPEIRLVYPELELLHHIPNGGTRNKIEAGKLKAQGVKAGVPDLCLPVPRKGFHGLYIEMKKPGQKIDRESQQRWIYLLKELGYHVAVCNTWTEAVTVLSSYLQGGK